MKNLLVVAALLVGSSAFAEHHEKKDKKVAKAAAAVDCNTLKDDAKLACEKAKAEHATTETAPAEKTGH